MKKMILINFDARRHVFDGELDWSSELRNVISYLAVSQRFNVQDGDVSTEF